MIEEQQKEADSLIEIEAENWLKTLKKDRNEAIERYKYLLDASLEGDYKTITALRDSIWKAKDELLNIG